MGRRPVELPSVGQDFNHAPIEQVVVGPRREVTLTLSVIPDYRPGNPRPASQSVRVRFGGIENFAEASAFFAAGPHERSELACLRYAEGRLSKPGCLFFELVFERIDARLVVQCSSLQVGVGEAPDAAPDPGADAAPLRGPRR